MKIKQLLFYALLLPMFFVACSKSDDPTPEPEPQPEEYKDEAHWVPKRAKLVKELNYKYTQILKKSNGEYPTSDERYIEGNFEVRDGKGYVFLDESTQVYYVVDWPAGAAHGSGQSRPLYFNFDKLDTVKMEDAQNGSAEWHISHQDIYVAYIYSNATSSQGQVGKGKIRIVNTPFDELNEAPAEPMIVNNVNIEMNDYEPVLGWGWYRLSDHILRPYPDRTMILHLRDERYVKYQLVNLYRTNPLNVTHMYQEPAPFLNFRFFIQQTPNNRNIKTKN